jgi:hypothetical protein
MAGPSLAYAMVCSPQLNRFSEVSVFDFRDELPGNAAIAISGRRRQQVARRAANGYPNNGPGLVGPAHHIEIHKRGVLLLRGYFRFEPRQIFNRIRHVTCGVMFRLDRGLFASGDQCQYDKERKDRFQSEGNVVPKLRTIKSSRRSSIKVSLAIDSHSVLSAISQPLFLILSAPSPTL